MWRTCAHKDIAFAFASRLSVEFKPYRIKEFQRLKAEEQRIKEFLRLKAEEQRLKEFLRLKDEEQRQIGWGINRNLVKINYRIRPDAIKGHLIPKAVTPAHARMAYAVVFNWACDTIRLKQIRDAAGSIRRESKRELKAPVGEKAPHKRVASAR